MRARVPRVHLSADRWPRHRWSRSRQRIILPVCLGLVVALLALAGCGNATSRPAVAVSGATSSAAVPTDEDTAPASADTSAGSNGSLASYITRLPHFGTAPKPQPVAVSAGPQASWFLRIPTTQPVAFLTIDDGFVKSPDAPKLFAAAHVPVTLFLTMTAIKDNPVYFKPFQADGAVIEDHTVSHVALQGKPYDYQRTEICGGADQLAADFGTRPVLFRPPGGSHDANTLKAAHDCGMKAAFYWSETVNTGTVRYQKGNSIQPGDIILMHFRPAFDDDFLAALTAIHNAGLTPALLTDYLS
jgi:peptidoglycan/xylan/chitin deacetylase (PgdA/CDA1 family)